MRNWIIKNFNLESKDGDIYLKLTALDTFSNRGKNLTGATGIKITKFLKVEDFKELVKDSKFEKQMKMQIMDVLKQWDWVFSIKDELETKIKSLLKKETKILNENSFDEFVKEKKDILALSPEDKEEDLYSIVEMFSSEQKKVLRILSKKLAEAWKEKVIFTGSHKDCLKKLQEIERIRVELNEFIIMSNEIELFPWLKSKVISLNLDLLWEISEEENEDEKTFYSFKNKKQDVKYKYIHLVKVEDVFEMMIKPKLNEIIELNKQYNTEWKSKELFSTWINNLKEVLKSTLDKELLDSKNNLWIDNIKWVEDSLYRKYDKFNFKVWKIFKYKKDEIRLQFLSEEISNLISKFFMDNNLSFLIKNDLVWDIVHFSEKEIYNLFLNKHNSYWHEFRDNLKEENAMSDCDKLKIESSNIHYFLQKYVQGKNSKITPEKAKELVDIAWQYNSSTISDSIWSKLHELI